ncbi:MAG TPA: glycosyltransferase [Roseiflexaceae bacterium]|nr:glycosyltransferase [Roseiflexaceae bacterium]
MSQQIASYRSQVTERNAAVTCDLRPAPNIGGVRYLGAYLPSYARHRVIQRGLYELGVEVEEIVDRGGLPARWWRLAQALRRTPARTPIVVGEAGNYLTPVLLEARRLGLPLLFDPFISLRDSIEDTASGWRRATLAPLLEVIDRLNNWAAGAVILDTPQTRAYFVERLGLSPAKAHVAYVGAETNLFHPRPRPERANGPVRVLFYGTFIPLQGIDIIIRAAAELQRETPDVQFQIVGSGQTSVEMRALADQLQTRNVTFGPASVPYQQLPELIASADICLGIFADRPKTARVIPNKLYQCAAMGLPVITANTPAIRAAFGAGELALVPPGDHQALAAAILTLAADQEQRRLIGTAGMRAVHSRYSPRIVATQVLEACQSIL